MYARENVQDLFITRAQQRLKFVYWLHWPCSHHRSTQPLWFLDRSIDCICRAVWCCTHIARTSTAFGFWLHFTIFHAAHNSHRSRVCVCLRVAANIAKLAETGAAFVIYVHCGQRITQRCASLFSFRTVQTMAGAPPPLVCHVSIWYDFIAIQQICCLDYFSLSHWTIRFRSFDFDIIFYLSADCFSNQMLEDIIFHKFFT